MSQFQSPQSKKPPGARLVAVSFALACVAVVATNMYIAKVRETADEDSFTVYLLNHDVRPGDALKSTSVRPSKHPLSFKESLQAQGYLDKPSIDARIADREKIERSARENDLITSNLFISHGSRVVDRNITKGMRLISLPIHGPTVTQVLHVGMYVDIDGTFASPQGTIVVLPVLERMRVIALGSRTAYDVDEGTSKRSGRAYKTMTFEVTPEQATDLQWVQRLAMGEFSLHVRNPTDDRLVKIPGGGINPAVLDLIEHAQGMPMSRKRR